MYCLAAETNGVASNVTHREKEYIRKALISYWRGVNNNASRLFIFNPINNGIIFA
jgi:predicted acetyltransferase